MRRLSASAPNAGSGCSRDHHVLVEQLVAHHDGTVMKFERDGFLASFNSAHAGLHAAMELQRTFSGDSGGGQPSSRSASACTRGS